ncbi:hypothetical protein QTJ16_000020 [Diplocarpon rosae]|uniref:Carboxylic ester hydrolase n=1 Tax=Diplocarpon rosae TaxID=946125 RepID=A0AAD9T4J7_9HELO|nr:hypothetical protein QTJ16_000020 [Diplocarpon rosae]
MKSYTLLAAALLVVGHAATSTAGSNSNANANTKEESRETRTETRSRMLARSYATANATLPVVDLGYSLHQASLNTTGSYYNFTNIRYAQAPVGDLRYALPEPPTGTSKTVEDGGSGPITCFQASPSWQQTTFRYLLGQPASKLSEAVPTLDSFNFSSVPPLGAGASEDCLFLDVMVPTDIFTQKTGPGASVLVWIHGGGYVGGGKSATGSSGNPAGIIARSLENNGEGVIFVSLNYRLGVTVHMGRPRATRNGGGLNLVRHPYFMALHCTTFTASHILVLLCTGWLAGSSFQTDAPPNLGLYDQRLALQWVQDNMSKFGGDPARVTVAGESAGAGSIMFQLGAHGGQDKAPFQQAIIQSPAFNSGTTPVSEEDVFQDVLTYASRVSNTTIASVADLRTLTSEQMHVVNYVASALSPFGIYPVGPVVDGTMVPAMPGQFLAGGQFDASVKVMVAHNAREGELFSSPFVTNETSFELNVRRAFPGASDRGVADIAALYPPAYNGSSGYTTPVQRMATVHADATFVCHTRWLNQAFQNNTYAYHFATLPGYHGVDIAHTFYDGSPGRTIFGSAVDVPVATALQDYMTSFVMTSRPNRAGSPNPAFPLYGPAQNTLLLNTTGLGTVMADPSSAQRCEFWQKGVR